MATRAIVKEGDEILRKRSREVTVFDRRLHMLLDDMIQTMREANGAGLAAVQVGVLRRVVVVDIGDDSGLVELVNPVVTWESAETITANEACLSFPGEAGVVIRPWRVTVTAQDRYGSLFTVDGEELRARAFCHEIDHLDGVLFIDRATRMLAKDEQYEEA